MAFFSIAMARYHSTLMFTESKKKFQSAKMKMLGRVIHSHVTKGSKCAGRTREKNHMSPWYTINLFIIKHGNLLFMIVRNDFVAVGFMSCCLLFEYFSRKTEPNLRFDSKNNIHDNPTNYYCLQLTIWKISLQNNLGGRKIHKEFICVIKNN